MPLAAKSLGRMANVDGVFRTGKEKDMITEFPSFLEDALGETDGCQPMQKIGVVS